MPKAKRQRSRQFVITLNNYTEDDLVHMNTWFKRNCMVWIIGKEVGEECKTPHLQAYCKFRSPKDFKIIKDEFPRSHIEKAKGTVRHNYDYCSKEGDFLTNIDFRSNCQKLADMCLAEYENVEWKPWQSKIIDLIKEAPHERKIHWYFERKGNVGKSYLCKYLAIKYDVVICDGKKENIFNQVKTLIDKGGVPAIILLDVPRTNVDYINYGAIEQLKNGMMYSGKYEGGQCIFPIPHVIAFANSKPDQTAMSLDRWEITEL